MHREGHVGLSFLFYAPLAYGFVVLEAFAVFGLGLVGIVFWSQAPDIDLQVPFLAHRGLTHTFLAALVAGILTAIVAVWLASLGVGGSSDFVIRPPILALPAAAATGLLIGVLGVLTHLVGDVLTPMGIRPKEPFSNDYYCVGIVRAADKQVNEALSYVGALAIVASVVAAEMG